MNDVNTTSVERPFGLPAESIEIIIDLPIPTSANRIWRHSRGHVYQSKEYATWQKECDTTVLINRQYPRQRIAGPFEFCIYLARNSQNSDGDNRVKAALDWLQSREIIRNDRDCQKGRWEWVPTAEAPLGCRVHLRSLHDQGSHT